MRDFLAWCDHPDRQIPLVRITPGDVGDYLAGPRAGDPDQEAPPGRPEEVLRPARRPPRRRPQPGRLVRAERYSVVEGKTPEIGAKQARDLLKSIDASNLVGLRDRAIIAVLIYTAARVGAVAKLTLKSLKHDGTQYALRFSEKGGKSREIPVRHDLEQFLRDYIEAAGITEGPLFRTGVPPDEDADDQGDERHRHLPDDEAAAQGGGPAGAVLAPLVPRGDGHGPAGAERARWRTCSTWPATPTRGRRGSTTGGGGRSTRNIVERISI